MEESSIAIGSRYAVSNNNLTRSHFRSKQCSNSSNNNMCRCNIRHFIHRSSKFNKLSTMLNKWLKLQAMIHRITRFRIYHLKTKANALPNRVENLERAPRRRGIDRVSRGKEIGDKEEIHKPNKILQFSWHLKHSDLLVQF